jgi:arginine deiminase
MVCSPGLAHLRLTPDTCDELLFDDVLWVDRAKRDHFEFVTKMRDRGVEVLEMHDLLAEVVGTPEARSWVLDRKVTDDLVGPGLAQELRAWLDQLPPPRLAELLIGGATWRDVPEEFAGPFLTTLRSVPGHPSFALPPLPNT